MTLPVRTFQTFAPAWPAERIISSSEEIARVRISERWPGRSTEEVNVASGIMVDLSFLGGRGMVYRRTAFVSRDIMSYFSLNH